MSNLILETLDDLHDQLVEATQNLARAVDEVALNHTMFVVKNNNAEPDWSKKSALALRTRKRGTSVTIEWCKVKWIGKKANGTRRVVLDSLPKARSVESYNLEVLRKLAQPWELNSVIETEEKLAQIRKQLKAAQRVLTEIRNAKQMFNTGNAKVDFGD